MTCWISSSTRTAGSSGGRASACSPPSWPPAARSGDSRDSPTRSWTRETLTIDTRRQHAVFTPWTAPGQSLTFDTDPERVVLQTADGQTIESRTNPRAPFAGQDLNSHWDSLQVGYFLSYGLWNYLSTPFLLTY